MIRWVSLIFMWLFSLYWIHFVHLILNGITIVSVETCRLIRSFQFSNNLEWDPWYKSQNCRCGAAVDFTKAFFVFKVSCFGYVHAHKKRTVIVATIFTNLKVPNRCYFWDHLLQNLSQIWPHYEKYWKIFLHTCNLGTAVAAAIWRKLTSHFLHDSSVKKPCRISWKPDGLVADTSSQTSRQTLSPPRCFFFSVPRKVVTRWWQLLSSAASVSEALVIIASLFFIDSITRYIVILNALHYLAL